jgi:hypothetical protein
MLTIFQTLLMALNQVAIGKIPDVAGFWND